MDKYIVTASSLNLRATPNGRIVGILQKNEIVEFTELSDSIWYNVKTKDNVFGFVSSKYLKKIQTNTKGMLRFGVDKVNMNGSALRTNSANASVLSESIPKTKNLFDIVTFLDVENDTHKRYLAKRSSTYCNIYAHDFAYCVGAYLPRVWWNGNFKKGSLVTPTYAVNLFEMNANSLTDWLKSEGKDFGWDLSVNEKALQLKVNEGGYFGVISAKDSDGIGHITVVLPTLNVTDKPLQSQAGRYNQYLFKSDWFKHNKFNSVVFAYCKIEKNE